MSELRHRQDLDTHSRLGLAGEGAARGETYILLGEVGGEHPMHSAHGVAVDEYLESQTPVVVARDDVVQPEDV